jgi:hypothetical protein
MLVIVSIKTDQPELDTEVIAGAKGYKVEDGVLVVVDSDGDDKCFPLINVREFDVRK